VRAPGNASAEGVRAERRRDAPRELRHLVASTRAMASACRPSSIGDLAPRRCELATR
jgi:hypothetical protein